MTGINFSVSGRWLALALNLMGGILVRAQDPAVSQTESSIAFDVASIKQNASNQTSWTMAPFKNGRFQVHNATVRQLLGIAYRRDILLVRGGPGWLDSDHFDIEAKTNAPSSPERDLPLLLQQLLRDRFRMQVHVETLPVQTLALVQARASSNLRPAGQRDCPAQEKPPPRCGGFVWSNSGLNAENVSMAGVTQWLTRVLGTLVFDRTDLTGRYDFSLEFGDSATALGNPASSSEALTSWTLSAVPQLGLKLEAKRIPLETVVVDKIDRPSKLDAGLR